MWTMCFLRFPGSAVVKNPTAMQETQEMQEIQIRSLSQEDPLEEMATRSNTLALEIPWTEEPGRTWLSD